MYALLVLSFALLSCCSALTDEEIALFYNDGCAGGSLSVTRDGDNILLSTNGVPDHKWQNCNPNIVSPQNVDVVLPSNPTTTDTRYCLSGGAIGWATNGVAIYNPFALGELNAVDGGAQETFDVCDGHPTPQNQYHYHRLPLSCVYFDGTQTEQFIGVARDGFPIYGPYQTDLGRDATNADLDECHGRANSDGAYRYVFLGRGEQNYPYVMGCYRAEPQSGGGPPAPAVSCDTCTNGESPCYGIGEVCTCVGMGGDEVQLLGYEETTEEGEGQLTQCEDAAESATCRDPHDQSPDSLDLEVLKTMQLGLK